MFKKLICLSLFSVSMLASCSFKSEEDKTILASNYLCILSAKDAIFEKPNVDEISANLNAKMNFMIYFSEKGCSACETFTPILKDYQVDTKALIYNFDSNDNLTELKLFEEKYGDKFFKKNSQGFYEILTPSLFIIKEGNVSEVNFDSYMKQKNAFSNYMNSSYRTNQIYLTNGNVLEKSIPDSFIYTSFDFVNENLVNLYRIKIRPNYISTNKIVVVSNYKEDSNLYLRLVSNKKIIKETLINSETSDELIKELF